VTPLFLVLLVIESTDLLFAIDSIPAVFAITDDAFIVFTSNVFAILGLRSLYFALAGMIRKFRYLNLTLVAVLAFVGVKMILAHHPKLQISTELSLAIIGGALVVGLMASLIHARTGILEAAAPIALNIEYLATLTYQQGRRIIVFVVGASVVIIGLILIVLPGPAFIVIPIGLAILATEFTWARRLLKRLKHEGANLASAVFGTRPSAANPEPGSDGAPSRRSGQEHTAGKSAESGQDTPKP
jgi:tellurite resistance protein TerC